MQRRYWLHPYLLTICEFQTSKGLEMLMYCPHKYKESEGKYWSPIKSKLDLQSRPFASESLFLGFLKEDLFYFSKNNFLQDFFLDLNCLIYWLVDKTLLWKLLKNCYMIFTENYPSTFETFLVGGKVRRDYRSWRDVSVSVRKGCLTLKWRHERCEKAHLGAIRQSRLPLIGGVLALST